MRRVRDFTIACLLIYAVIVLTYTVIAPAIGRIGTVDPIPGMQSTQASGPVAVVPVLPLPGGVSSTRQAPQTAASSAPLPSLVDLPTPVQWLLPLPLAILLAYWVSRQSHYPRGRRVLAFV